MQTSTILIASADERLGRDLAGSLAPSHQLRVTTQLQQVRYLLGETLPDLMLLDLRYEKDADKVANEIIQELPSAGFSPCVIALISPLTPDVLINHSENASIRRYLGPVSAVEVRALISRTFDALQKASAVAAPPAPLAPATTVHHSTPHFDQQHKSSPNEAVFEGVTRQMETRSPELKQMLDDLMVAAGHDVTILLIGETGSGKTFLSNLVHESSPRRNEPFLHIACGALPRDLLESELFGHAKGSFTSAHADKEGKFLAARRGTILLDEIDVLGPEQQVKLLRVIETGEFEPVGSNQTYRSQARLVVASNLDLQPLVEQGRFRPDLYYRLNMLKFEIPPLRKRKADIVSLAKKFVARFAQKHNVQIHRIEDSLLDALLGYPWPGNVRELEHVIQRTVIYCRNGVLSKEQLPPHLLAGHIGPTNDASVQLGGITTAPNHSLERQVALSEKEIIEHALLKNNFSRTRTAVDLGISRVTLYNKMKKYEMMK